ncbi:MAG: hypothetical protein JWR16_3208 [Nevskia sp.]|nr:hypothetical protein [Nevskia sp.]
MTLVEGLKRLVEHAKKDATFFHELVFDPEKVIGRLSYLDAKTKGAILQIDPASLIRNLIPVISAECGNTCGASSCTNTCGAGSCIDTCNSSCGGTCGNSCDKTSGFEINETPEDPFFGGIVAVEATGTARARGVKAKRRRSAAT